MKRRKHIAGRFLRIALADGTYTYGRELNRPYAAFYAYRTEIASEDLDVIERQPTLFRQAVRERGTEAWTVIGVRELTGDVALPVVRFTQELADFTKYTVYDSTGAERAATPQEWIGLERAAVWEAKAIEQRLLDTFVLGDLDIVSARPKVLEQNRDPGLGWDGARDEDVGGVVAPLEACSGVLFGYIATARTASLSAAASSASVQKS